MTSKAKVALEKYLENGGGAEVFEKFGVKGATASLQGFKGDSVPLRCGVFFKKRAAGGIKTFPHIVSTRFPLFHRGVFQTIHRKQTGKYTVFLKVFN